MKLLKIIIVMVQQGLRHLAKDNANVLIFLLKTNKLFLKHLLSKVVPVKL
jgi:hypothetical protein